MRAVWRAAAIRRSVYNLQIDGAHEFFANGVLVHNCDALRYLLLNLGGGAKFHFPEPDPAPEGLDPAARPAAAPLAPAAPLPNTFGGFPVAAGGSPWA